jgi:glucose/arabinose dehydrogenase/PKD repeat protein
VLSGLDEPTAVQFAADGRVFVAEKSGVVKVFDSLADTSPTVFADLRTNVYNAWDRGLLGLALHPSFPAVPYVYVLYTHDAEIGGTAPLWGIGLTSDPCPDPPGFTSDGCVVSGRLSRLLASGNTMIGAEDVLIEDWCQQYSSHSIGTLAFGADGALYVSGGDGASFNFVDYGQRGIPRNPCGDPPSGVGGTQTAPAAEGGSLRSQDLRSAGDPVTLDGTILRVDPDTGEAMPDNPLFGSPDPNARRVIAYGLRNPFRLTIRPGSGEVWVGDVGWNIWEEINRIPSPTAGVTNFGWPCYEGPNRQAGYEGTNLSLCEQLYGVANAVTAPLYAYRHADQVVPGDDCGSGSSSISGLAFYTGGPYPAEYDGALFFADYSRNCIWVMFNPPAPGSPPPTIATFDAGAATPVDLKIGPGGDLFYVDVAGGTVRRIQFLGGNQSPTAVAQASPVSGPAPLTVTFDGTASSDPDGDALAYAWDLDGDGEFDDSDEPRPAATYDANGTYVVRLQVSDGQGGFDVSEPVIVTVGGGGVLPGLVAAFGLNEGGGQSAGDVSGLANHGSVIGAAWSTAGRFGGALSFDGIDDFVSVPDAPSLDLGSTGTIEAWVRLDRLGRWQSVMAKGAVNNDRGHNYALEIVPANLVRCILGNGTSFLNVDSTIAVAAGQFYHLACTWDGTTVKLHIDGTLNRSVSQTLTPGANTAPLFIGQFGGNADRLDGHIDEVRVYSRALTTGEIQADMNTPVGSGGPANGPPTAVIDTPQGTATWKVGDVIQLSGHGADPQDGTLPASALRWTVILHHCPSNCHAHVLGDLVGVASGAIAAPDHEYPSHLELQLTVTDSGGLTHTTSVLLQPQVVSLTLQSTPPGLQLGFNAGTATTPFTRTVIVGSNNSMGAPSPQVLGGAGYAFASWSDGGAQSHDITAGTTAATYTAVYEATEPPTGPPGLVAAYGFNEGSGGAAGDGSGHGHTGTVSGATWTAAGKFGGALVFSGANSWVTVADSDLLDLSTGMTLSAWVNPAVSTGWRTVVMKEQAAGLAYALYGSSTGSLPASHVHVGGAERRVAGSSALPMSTWRHLAATFDGAILRLYVDGVQVGSLGRTGSILVSAGPLRIGGNGVWGEYFQGMIDEVRVYNRALSPSEIQTDMNTPVP